MNLPEIREQLSEIRRQAIAVIKQVMESVDLCEINVQETESGDYPITHEVPGSVYVLSHIDTDSRGNLWFESESEFDMMSEDEDDLPADTLLKIAEWLDQHKDYLS